jgi:DNA-binding response OmpR family regulator
LSELLLLTNVADPPGEILPAISLLLHTVRTAPADATALADSPAADAVLVDARRDLVRARELCRLLRGMGVEIPLLAVLTEGGLAAVTADWGADDVILSTAGPAEVEARLRLTIGRQASLAPAAPDEIRSGDLAIDEATYSARLRNRALDLTFKEFELLKFLAQHPGRVFTRAHLLQEVWGYDYFGGTRTVDVHVRRLRAKLGAEHEALIGTVRNVGYRFVPLRPDGSRGQPRGAGDVTPEDTPVSADPGADGGRARDGRTGDQDGGHAGDTAASRLPGENRSARPAPEQVPAPAQVERRGSSPARADR